jgi:hypothetical protein
MHMVMKFGAPIDLLRTYEEERKPVAKSVIETSGELVRSTKYSEHGTHATDYVDIVQRRAGFVTGMGVRYGDEGIEGTRLFDFQLYEGSRETRIYSLLDYSRFTLLVFGEQSIDSDLPQFVQVIRIRSQRCDSGFWAEDSPYENRLILVRPDAYIAAPSLAGQIGLSSWMQQSPVSACEPERQLKALP